MPEMIFRFVYTRMTFRFLNFAFISVFLCLLTGLSYAGNVNILEKDNDFLITKWTTEDGLPQNTVTSIVQTNDGYIWIGTFGGLARFDGIKFTVFDPTNTPGLTSNRILSLYEDSRKILWVGTETGEVYRVIDGEFRKFNSKLQPERKSVLKFQEDGNEIFFIASDSGLEKFRFDEKGEIIPGSAKILTREEDSNIYLAPENKVWMRIKRNLYLLDKGQHTFSETEKVLLPEDPLEIQFTKNGQIIVGALQTLGIYENKTYQEILPFDPDTHKNRFALNNQNETLWLQQANELYEFNDSELIRHDLNDFVKGGSSLIFFDSENNLWLGTNYDGLVRLTPRKIGLVGDITDFDLLNTYSVIEDSKGTIWIAGSIPLKIQNGRATEFVDWKEPEDLPLLKTLAFDSDDTLWLGGFGGLFYYKDENLTPVKSFPGEEVYCLFFDNEGSLWIGGPNGVWKYKDGKYRHFTLEEGLVDDRVHLITQTKDETIWLGTVSGISKIKDGKIENVTSKNGLSNNNVREILEDEDGTIWIGTYGGGIDRFRNGKIQAITKAQGLHDNFISRILVDDYGKFWVLGNRGIFAVSRDELNEVADKKKNTLIGSIYGVADGMKSSEASGGHQPAGIKTRDGKLWFPMIKDMVIIDPKQTELIPPKVVIESASSRFENYETEPRSLLFDDKKVFEVETEQKNLEINYTGLNFTKPEKIRFFFKMEGLDEDWVDAGTRRTAFYPYLPPGKYTFLVKAVNADGIWSEETASLSIDVAKHFWQTWWFMLISICAFLAIVFLIYRFRLKQLEKRQLLQEEFSKRLLNAHESERKRIAKELHDGLGQNLLVIKNWAQLGLNNSAKGQEKIRKHFEGISEAAAEALSETRGIVRNLTPQHLKRFGLTEAICNALEQIEDSTGIVFEKDINSIDGRFSEETELSIYRIIQESLNNIVKHSESSRGKVLIDYFNNELKIIIQDFGKGFSNENFLENNSGGFGLRNISQRVKLLGGDLRIDSTISVGTRIFINIRIKNA